VAGVFISSPHRPINLTLTINWANFAASGAPRAWFKGQGPVQGFFGIVKSLGAAHMATMAAVSAALIGFFSFVMLQVTAPQMVPRFTDLSVDDSASIIKDLERQGTPI
jgi:hypothetical protein